MILTSTSNTFHPLLLSMEIILRAEAVEQAQAGDKCDFTGTLIVVPDVAQLNMPGAKAETKGSRRGAGPGGDVEGRI